MITEGIQGVVDSLHSLLAKALLLLKKQALYCCYIVFRKSELSCDLNVFDVC